MTGQTGNSNFVSQGPKSNQTWLSSGEASLLGRSVLNLFGIFVTLVKVGYIY